MDFSSVFSRAQAKTEESDAQSEAGVLTQDGIAAA